MSNKPTIFVSYCSIDSGVVNTIDNDLRSVGVDIIRDTRDAKNYQSIKVFMKRIKNEDYALVIVSDSFLKSENCMYEILEFMKDDNYKDRIIPIVLRTGDDNIFSSGVKIKYKNHWIERFKELKAGVSNFSPDDMEGVSEEFKHIRNIRTHIGEFLETIKDTKCLSVEELKKTNYMDLLDKIGFKDADLLTELIGIYSIEDIEEQDISAEEFCNNHPNYPMGHYHVGNIEFHRKNYKKAKKKFDLAIKLDSTISMFVNDRGGAFYKLKQFDKAISDYKTAIQLSPEEEKYYYSLATVLDESENFREAISNYDKAIEINPDVAMFYNNRGSSYFMLENYEEAISNYEEALKIDPSLTMARMNKEGAEQRAKAIGYSINPNDAFEFYNEGNKSADLGQYRNALLSYGQALEANPKFYECYFNRGITYAEMGRYQEALSDYECAININPSDADVYYSQGNSYKKLGKHKEAIESYSKAIKRNPRLLSAYRNRGNTYKVLNEHEKAIDDYKKIQAIKPNDKLALLIQSLEMKQGLK